jgi:hypothetical protein
MIEVRQIETAPNLVFDVSVGGPDDGPPVLMLHGFCVSRHFWKAQVDALDAAGYRAVATEPARLRRWCTSQPGRSWRLFHRSAALRRARYHRGTGPRRSALPSRRPRLGRQPLLGHRPALAGAGGLAYHALSPASPLLHARARDAGRSTSAQVSPPQGLPRCESWAGVARRQCQMGARPADPRWRAGSTSRGSPFRARHSSGDGGSAGAVPGTRRAARTDWLHQSADALHLG